MIIYLNLLISSFILGFPAPGGSASQSGVTRIRRSFDFVADTEAELEGLPALCAESICILWWKNVTLLTADFSHNGLPRGGRDPAVRGTALSAWKSPVPRAGSPLAMIATSIRHVRHSGRTGGFAHTVPASRGSGQDPRLPFLKSARIRPAAEAGACRCRPPRGREARLTRDALRNGLPGGGRSPKKTGRERTVARAGVARSCTQGTSSTGASPMWSHKYAPEVSRRRYCSSVICAGRPRALYISLAMSEALR